jgi:glycosyltransferase involved in cell wall biosynthesis
MDPVTGGVSQGLRNSIPEWDKYGHSTQIVCLDSPDADYLKQEILPILCLGPAKSPWQYSNKLYPWLIKNLSDFDVVIVEGIWQYHSFAVFKAIKGLKRLKVKCPKFYIMPHGMLDPYFQKAESRKLKAIRNEIYWRLVEAKCINAADAILFTCQEELLLARTTFKNYKPKGELNVGFGIPNIPDYSDAMKKAFLKLSQLADDEKYFLFLSRIHPKKGADILINVYIDLIKNSSLPINEWPTLVVAGPGLETDYAKELLNKVLENKLMDKIKFTGMLSNDSKWGAFYGAEAYILCSHQENFGISVVESLACSKPVIISNQINIWREIDASGAGIICDDNEASLKQAMLKWFELNNEHKMQMGKNALESYTKYFHVKSACEKMIESIL